VNGQTVDEGSGLLDASSSKERTLSAGFGDTFYTVPEGGSYDVTLTLSGQSGWSTSTTQTVEFDGPSGQITGLDTYFIDNYDTSTADLSSVSFNLQNTGDVVLDYDTIEIEMDGTTVTDSPISRTLEPGRSTYISPSVDLTVSEGTQELTVRVLDGSQTVAETTNTVSAGDGE
jgi:archaellum component FlaF (FlaF/FlaG flagellin family)